MKGYRASCLIATLKPLNPKEKGHTPAGRWFFLLIAFRPSSKFRNPRLYLLLSPDQVALNPKPLNPKAETLLLQLTRPYQSGKPFGVRQTHMKPLVEPYRHDRTLIEALQN